LTADGGGGRHERGLDLADNFSSLQEYFIPEQERSFCFFLD